MDGLTRLLTPGDVAQVLGIHPKTVERMARAGKIPHLKIGRYYRFVAKNIAGWIDKGGVGTVASEVPAVPSSQIHFSR
jgi:excisionase family DNA binding protein